MSREDDREGYLDAEQRRQRVGAGIVWYLDQYRGTMLGYLGGLLLAAAVLAGLILLLVRASDGQSDPAAVPDLPVGLLSGTAVESATTGDDVMWTAEVEIDSPLQPGDISRAIIRSDRFDTCHAPAPGSPPLVAGDRFRTEATGAEWVEPEGASRRLLVDVSIVRIEC